MIDEVHNLLVEILAINEVQFIEQDRQLAAWHLGFCSGSR